MRVTQSMIIRSALDDLNRARARLVRTQEQAASGLRINRPSDDPVGTSAAMLLKSGLEATSQYQRNINQTRTRLSSGENALANATDLLVRAKELALQGANATQNAATRAQIAEEVESLHSSMLAEANSRIAGGALFGGYTTDTAPFVASGPFIDLPPSSPTVAFAGDRNEIEIQIDEAVRTRATANGQRVFMGDADGDGSVDGGREDIFQLLADLRDGLATNNVAQVDSTIPRLDAAMSQISVERTHFGASLTQLDTFEKRLDDRFVDLTARLSDTQDADSLQVFSDLASQEVALQASLQANARLIQSTLLDFIG
ncbi:MAG: flagellar hook-associated protein 3 [bacterium]|nr:flagellar hook-associated protein 3 [bacterium]MCP5067371.1 flagellar hook-associated protein 3 [bacterium]